MYKSYTKEELLTILETKDNKIEELHDLNTAQEALISIQESNKEVDWQVIREIIDSALDQYSKRFNLANPNKIIKFNLTSDVGMCKPFLQGTTMITAKAILNLKLSYKSVVSSESITHDVCSASFGFRTPEEIENNGWEKTLYTELLRTFIGCVHMTVDAKLKTK